MKSYQEYEFEVSLESLSKHPRLVELNFILFYGRLKQIEGVAATIKLLEALCDLFNVDFKSLKVLIDNEALIKRNKVISNVFWIQEVVLLGSTRGLSKSQSFVRLLGYSKTYHYQKHKFLLKEYIDKEWLERLERSVCLLKDEALYKDIKAFMNAAERLKEVI